MKGQLRLLGGQQPFARPARRPSGTVLKLEALEDRSLLSITIQTVPLKANDLIYDPGTQLIYVSVPGSAGTIGNTITRLDPVTAKVGDSVFVGSEPTKLTESNDDEYLYVALNGAGAVRRYDIPSQTADIQFDLGQGSFGTRFAEDLAAVPGSPHSVAVARVYHGVSPSFAGLAIYTDGVPGPNPTPDGVIMDSIAFNGAGGALYGYDNQISDFAFRQLNVADPALRLYETTGGIMCCYNTYIKYDAGLIYSTHGEVINPNPANGGPPQLVGTLSGIGFASSLAPDSANDRVYVLTGSQLMEFKESTFALVASYNLPSGGNSLIRWGGNGLAYQNGTNVYVITITDNSAPFVADPRPALGAAVSPLGTESVSQNLAVTVQSPAGQTEQSAPVAPAAPSFTAPVNLPATDLVFASPGDAPLPLDPLSASLL